MTSKKISITTEFLATLKNMDKVVADIDKGLSNTKIDLSKNNGFTKLISNFKDEYTKFLSLTKNNEVDLLDAKEVEKSAEKILKTFRELETKYGNLSKISMENAKKLFPENFSVNVDKATRAIDNFKKSASNLGIKTQELDVEEKKLANLKNQLDEISNTKIKSDFDEDIKKAADNIKVADEALTNFLENLKKTKTSHINLPVLKGKVTRLTNKRDRELPELKKQIAEKETKRSSLGRTSADNEQRKKLNEEIGVLQTQVKKLEDDVRTAQKELDNKTKEKQDIEKNIDKFKTGKGDGSSLTNKEAKEYNNLTNSLNNAKNAQAQLIAEQKKAYDSEEVQTAAINKKNLEIENQQIKINKLKETISSLSQNSDYDNLFKSLQSLGVNTEGIEHTAEGLEEIVKSLEKADAQALENIRTKLAEMGVEADDAENYVEQVIQELHGFKNTTQAIKENEQELSRLRQQIISFFSIDNAIQLFKRSIRSAYETVKELDAAMTETAVVTDFSVGDMWDQLPRYTKAANELGTTTLGAYETMTLFYQQGLKTNEVFEIGTETMKMARIANMDYADATDKMTAALRGFNMELNETSAQRVNDVYSELAAITAADTNEIATAMTKTASIADSANMKFETTAAFLSQIIETTRESAETAGTAMKTVVARFQELKKDPAEIGEVDGEIVDANKIETALRTINVALRDTSGQFRDLDDVFLEIASKWDTLDTNTQRYIATMAAGSRQQSRFIAMMSNYDRTMELVNAANNSAGASQRQFEKTTESLESKLNKLKNAWDAFTMGITNSTLIKTGVDLLTGFLSILNKLIDGISGESGLIKAIASIGIAWGGLKLGGNILKKLGFGDTLIGQGFSKLFPKKDGEKAGESLAESIKKGFKRASKKGEGLGFKGFFTNSDLDKDFDKLAKNLGDKHRKLLEENDDFREEYLDSLKINNSQFSDSQLLEIQMEFDANGIEAANAKVKEFGGTVKVTEGMIENSSGSLSKLSLNYQNVGAAATLTGGILVGFGTILSEAGYEEAGEGLQKIGAAFIGIGQAITILPTLFKPVIAKLVAGGLSVQAAWWWVTAIVVAVAALGAAIAFAISEAQKATIEGKIKAAEERTKAAKESAEKAKEAYDNLLNDKEKYGELQNTLDNLVKGTLEWKEALIEANQQVLNLLTTYPELAKHLQTGENGQITIAEEGFEEILQNQIKGMKNAQAAVSMAQINEQQLKEEKANRELQKKFRATTGYFYFDNYVVPINSGSGVAVNYGAGFDSDVIYEKDIMDQMLSAFRNSPEELFKIDENGNYSRVLLEIAEQSDQTAEDLWNLKDALAEYDSALVASEITKQNLAKTVLTSKASEETLGYKYSDNILNRFSKGIIDINKNEISKESNKIYATDGIAEKDKENGRFVALAKQYGVLSQMTGDDKLDLQKLYVAMSGLESIEDIPEAIKNDKRLLADEIASISLADKASQRSEEFRIKLENVKDEKVEKEIAALLSGDISQFTIGEFKKLGNLEDYYDDLGYGSSEAMASDLGYDSKYLNQLNQEDQIIALENLIKNNKITLAEGETFENLTPERIQELLEANGIHEISAELQFSIDNQQLKQQMQAEFDKASASLSSRGIEENLYEHLSIGTVANLSEQITTFSNENAKKYIDTFNKVLAESDLGKGQKESLEKYLSTVDWSSMTEAIKAVDYMQSLGIDSSLIKEYWDVAVQGANTYISSLEEALSIVERLQSKLQDIAGITERLAEGTATYADMMALVEAGVDISNFQLTTEGWKATAEETEEAAKALKRYQAEQAKMVAERQAEAFNDARNKLYDGITYDEKEGKYRVLGGGGLSSITTVDDEGRLVGGEVTTENKNKIGDALDLENAAQLTVEEIQKAYDDYIALLNNGEDIIAITEKMAAFSAAQSYTGSEAEVLGHPEESVLYSIENEANEAGLNSTEVLEYADALAQANTELDKITAAQVALNNTKLNTGLSEIIDSYEDWTSIIDDSTGALKDTSSTGVATYNKLKESVNKMLNTSVDLSDAFWDNADNMKNIKRAAEGDVAALEDLQKAAAADYIIQLDANIDDENISSKLQELATFISDFDFPKLEAGDILDNQEFIDKCQELINASGMTALEVSDAFKAMGFDVKFKNEEVTRMVPITTTEGTYEDLGNGNYKRTEKVYTDYEEVTGTFPVIETLTSTGSGGGGVSIDNISSGKSAKEKSSKSGGGSKSWENPYDKFYNLTETINKNLREREKLERTYNKLLREQQHILNTIDYEKNLSDQINNLKQQANKLRREYALQSTMYSGKGNELQSYMAKNSSMRKYGYYDAASQQIVIDWNAINKVKDDEKGQKIEDYISKLEELRDAMWDAEDAMLDAEEQIEEMKEDLREKLEELKQAYLDFEDRIVEALVAQRQAEIDELQEVYDLMSESNNSVLSAIQEVINEQRRLRELEEQKADIEEMQRRLAMLRQDTSGASDLEIKALEEQIGDAQQSYTDSLIDQAIDEMGTANEKAEEQRQQQIDLLQHQLDWDKENGKFWTQVNELLSTAINPDGSLNNNSPLVELLKNTEGYKAMSEFGKQNWWTNLQKTVAEAMAGLKEWLNPTDVDAAIGGIQGGDAGIVGGVGSDNGNSSGGSGSGGVLKRGSAVGDLQRMLNFLGFNAGKVDNAYGENTKAAVKRLQKYLNISSDGLYGKKTYDALIRNEYYYEAEVFKDLEEAGLKIPAPMFKTGGLADFTGPAWLDGTKTHPEIVLNARDSANFLELRDILRDMNLVSEGKTSGGDNYFEIHIEVDTLSNDYDVEQVADKVKRIINDDARYRNTNAINLIR